MTDTFQHERHQLAIQQRYEVEEELEEKEDLEEDEAKN